MAGKKRAKAVKRERGRPRVYVGEVRVVNVILEQEDYDTLAELAGELGQDLRTFVRRALFDDFRRRGREPRGKY